MAPRGSASQQQEDKYEHPGSAALLPSHLSLQLDSLPPASPHHPPSHLVVQGRKSPRSPGTLPRTHLIRHVQLISIQALLWPQERSGACWMDTWAPVLGCGGHHNKAPQTGQLKQDSFQEVEVHDQGVGRAVSPDALLPGSLHGGGGVCSLPLPSCKDQGPPQRLHSTSITFFIAHLHTQSF